MLYLFFALAGWCGTPWPGRWPGPKPDPDPNPWFSKIAGVVGGLLGGLAISRILTVSTVPDTAPALTLAMLAGAFIGGRVLSDIAIIIVGGRSTQGVN